MADDTSEKAHDWLPLRLGGDDGLGNEYQWDGAWCRSCGALDRGEGNVGELAYARYYTVGFAPNSQVGWETEPPCAPRGAWPRGAS